MNVRTHTAEEMAVQAREFVLALESAKGGATFLALSGDLGAGKTTFVQAMAKALGVEESVTSPTFVLEKIYPIRDTSSSNGAGALSQGFKKLIHIDAYRLKGAHELEVLGWKELLADSGNLIVLEWPERVEELIPEDAIRIRFDIHGDERTISINGEEKY